MIRIRLRWEENAEKLAARLSEILAPMGIMPVLNRSCVILDDSMANTNLAIGEAARLAARTLLDLGIGFRKISSSENEIVVEDLEPRGSGKRGPRLFICPHCGFITPYEEEYWNHVKIHYLGF